MFALIAATLTVQTKTWIKPYNPHGPIIRVTMQNGGAFDITTDPVRSPKTVAHILTLVNSKFYDHQRIHRVEPWVTQWGAPASRNLPMLVKGKDGKMEVNEKVGDGGSGRDIPVFEGATDVDYLRGVVGIASTGLQVAGDSQLFVLKKDATRLWNSYAVVGKVTRGMNVVDAIKFGDRIKSMREIH